MVAAEMRVYNTLSRRKEELRPLEAGRVRVYSCGPTVYRYVHVGNLRTFMFADLLCRSLEYLGHRVEQVMNITDVGHLTDDRLDRGEDKMLLSARLEKRTAAEIAAHYTSAFREDIALLNIRPAAHYPRATDHVPRMIEMISGLLAGGHAYEAGGSVYYRIASFPAYGRLSRNSPAELLAGGRGEPDPRKEHPGDFTLWKAAGSRRQQVWASPWGPGFPGWHIECSAMSTALLGERFDIHTGGADNVFPHHEAEIAQSEAFYGHPVVSYWMHAEHLLLSGARMAKSAGNFLRIGEIGEGNQDPLAFRYLALQARYRAKLNFGAESMDAAARSLGRLRERVAQWRRGPDGPRGQFAARFRGALEDDLDLPAAMALVAELARSELAPGAKAGLLFDFDRVLGLDLGREEAAPGGVLPGGAPELLAERERARAARDFESADRLRDRLAEMGVAVTDGPGGQSWRVAPDR